MTDPITSSPLDSVHARIIGAIATRPLALAWCGHVGDAGAYDIGSAIDDQSGPSAEAGIIARELAAGRSPVLIGYGDAVIGRRTANGLQRVTLPWYAQVLLPSRPIAEDLDPESPGETLGQRVLLAELAAQRSAELASVFTRDETARRIDGLADDTTATDLGGVGLHPVYECAATGVIFETVYPAWEHDHTRAADTVIGGAP